MRGPCLATGGHRAGRDLAQHGLRARVVHEGLDRGPAFRRRPPRDPEAPEPTRDAESPSRARALDPPARAQPHRARLEACAADRARDLLEAQLESCIGVERHQVRLQIDRDRADAIQAPKGVLDALDSRASLEAHGEDGHDLQSGRAGRGRRRGARSRRGGAAGERPGGQQDPCGGGGPHSSSSMARKGT